ncbi:MAG: aminopeptidase P N-terminal domain-containing protein [Planctomycetota bacterium]
MKRNPPDICRARRQAVLKDLRGIPLLLRSAPEVLRNGDVHYTYRQDSNFHYLCGFDEPEAILLAVPEGRGHRTILFVRPRDKAREVWDGKRAGPAGAKRTYGADEAHEVADFWKVFGELTRDWEALAWSLAVDPAFDARLMALFGARLTNRPRKNQGIPAIVDPRPVIWARRQIKGPEEVELLQEAARISCEGHRVAMALAEPGMYEYEVQAELEAVFRRNGAPRVGYDSIVASGPNACTLHYVENSRRIRSGDLLLIDAAAEYGHYSADITRTFPVRGRFSPAQRAVYEAVLRCQKKCVEAIKPGNTVQKITELSQREITKGLLQLGLLKKGTLAAHMKKRSFAKYYMHGLGHWLGMDVHDCGPYQNPDASWIGLKPGMVMTVEPGIYIPADDRAAPPELRGIGVRIEDDVLVTRSGHRVLTADVPKEVADVEALTAG